MAHLIRQMFFIPTPELTEKNLPDQTGRVFIVTGGYTGCGYELSKILYAANGTVYIAGRSKSKADDAISNIHSSVPRSKGKLEFLEIDLADLKTIKPAADAFKAKESRLDVLTNNAGVMMPPQGSKDAQGFELQMGTNCLGPFLFTKLLSPLLKQTAAVSAPGSVRVTWAGSIAVDTISYNPGGVNLDERGEPVVMDVNTNYGQSKAGNLFLASESARRFKDDGVIHLCWNPGNLQTELQRHMTWWQIFILNNIICYPAIYGAYTELWAGLSPNIKPEHGGSYVVPWGRLGTFRTHISQALEPEAEGGTGKAQKFWDWCNITTAKYA